MRDIRKYFFLGEFLPGYSGGTTETFAVRISTAFTRWQHVSSRRYCSRYC